MSGALADRPLQAAAEPVAEGTGLVERISRHAGSRAQATAINCAGRQLSWAEFNAAANALALRLRAAGAGPDRLVAIALPRDERWPVAVLAILKSGAAWLPLDPALPAARLERMLALASPQLLLSSGSIAPGIAWTGTTLLLDELDTGSNAAEQLSRRRPDELCYVMFTSGSSGAPRGVRVLNRNLEQLFGALSSELAPVADDVWSASHSCAFGFSVWELFGALLHGATLLIVPDPVRNDPAALCRLLLQQRVTVLSLTPSAWRTMLAAADCAQLAGSALRLLMLSGEPVRDDDLAAWYRQLGTRGPRLASTYAITETAGQLCWREFSATDARTAANIGQPLPGRELHIIDCDGQVLPNGEIGEIHVSGDCVSDGYLAEEHLNAWHFPWLSLNGEPARRCYRSGDLARRLADGSLEFAGRADSQLKHHGYRIEPGEIEARLRAHPQLRDAAVGLRQDAAGNQRLVAWLVAGEPATGSAGETEIWPSLGGYQVYDPLLYDLMGAESVRVAAYRAAFERTVAGRVVLDMGTGRDALLARQCLAAGARHVYAVELIPEAAQAARELVARLGLDQRISVIEADVAGVRLPEAASVCTQGIIGNIGSADGIVPLWNAVQPLLAADCTPVPARCRTLVAALELPAGLREQPRFAPLARRYVRAIHEQQGGAFDVRLCLRNINPRQLLSDAALFEELDFHHALPATQTGKATLTAKRAGKLDGLLLWTVVELAPGISVDYLEQQQAWLPVFFPLPDTPVTLNAGDCLELRWRIVNDSDPRCPDYLLELSCQQAAGVQHFTLASRHREPAAAASPLHRQLLADLEQPEPVPSTAALRDWLAAELPDYMLPSAWLSVPELPLNSSGKLDRAALPAPGRQRPALASAFAPPQTALQQDLVTLWLEVLGIDEIGIDDDFFDLGGDSIAAVQLTTGLQRLLDDDVMLMALFDAPTIASLSGWLEREHPAAVERRYARRQ